MGIKQAVQNVANKVGGALQSGTERASQAVSKIVNPVVTQVGKSTGLSTTPSKSTYQGPQKPGYEFNSGGGSVPIRQGPLQPGTQFTPGGGTTKKSSGSGGGNQSQPMSIDLSKSTSKINVQAQSQQSQEQAKTLARQNVDTQRNALQRDQNYIIEKEVSGVVKPASQINAEPYYGEKNIGSAIKQSWSNLLNTQSIGSQGFSSYRENVFAPFYDVKEFRMGIGIGVSEAVGLYGAFKSGTSFKDIPLVALGKASEAYNVISRPGVTAYLSDIQKGISPDIAGLPSSVQFQRTAEGVSTKYQTQVNLGNLGLEEAKTSAQSEYETNINKLSSQIGKKGIYERLENAYKTPKQIIQFGVETAILSGVSELQTTKLLMDIPLLKAGTSQSYLSKINRAELLMDLERVTPKISGKELFRTSKEALYQLDTSKSIGSAKQEISYLMPVFDKSSLGTFAKSESGVPTLIEKGFQQQSFFISKGKSTTTIYDVISGETFKTTSKFGGGGKITKFPEVANIFKSFDEGKVSQKFEGSQIGLGQGYLGIEGEQGIKTFRVAGITKESDEFYNVLGIKTYKALVNLDVGSTKILGRVSAYGEIKRLPSSDFIKGFHSTSDVNLPGIYDKGLMSSSKTGTYQGIVKPLDYVSLGTSKDTTGFGLRSVTKQGGKIITFKAEIPKDVARQSSVQVEGLSGVNEMRFTEVSPQYLSIEGQQKLTSPFAIQSVNEQISRIQTTSLTPRTSLIEMGIGKTLPSFTTSSLSLSSSLSISQPRSKLSSLSSFGTNILPKSGTTQISGLGQLTGQVQKSQLTQVQSFAANMPSPSFGFLEAFTPFTTPKVWGGLPSLGGFALGFPKSRGRKSGQFNIAPSFTAIVKNIEMKSPLKVSATFGVTPFQTRGLLVGKKSKGDYFQLTDL